MVTYIELNFRLKKVHINKLNTDIFLSRFSTINVRLVRLSNSCMECISSMFIWPPRMKLLQSVHYSIVQYSTVKYSTIQYSTVQYSTVQCSTVRGASKIKLKNVNKKRKATARRLIFFGVSQGVHCCSDYTVVFIITKLWRRWQQRQRR